MGVLGGSFLEFDAGAPRTDRTVRLAKELEVSASAAVLMAEGHSNVVALHKAWLAVPTGGSTEQVGQWLCLSYLSASHT